MSYQQVPHSRSQRTSPRKSQRIGPFKTLRHMSSNLFNEDRGAMRNSPSTLNGSSEAPSRDTSKPKTKTRKGLSQLLSRKQDHGMRNLPTLPALPTAFATERSQVPAPQNRPRPSAGPDPFMPSASGVTMIPAGSAHKKASASARAMTAERHGSNLHGHAPDAHTPVESSWVHSLTHFNIGSDQLSSHPLSAEELPSRFSSLRVHTPIGYSPATRAVSTPRSGLLSREKSASDKKTRSKIWQAISNRSRRSTLKSQRGTVGRSTHRESTSGLSPPYPVSPPSVPAIRITRPSTGTRCDTPATTCGHQRSLASIRSEIRNGTPSNTQRRDITGHRPLPKRKSLAGLFGVALKRSSQMLSKTPTPPVNTPCLSHASRGYGMYEGDSSGRHFSGSSAGFQDMYMASTSTESVSLLHGISGRGVDMPRIIRSKRSFDEASTATGQLDRLVQALGQLSPTKRRQSSSPQTEKTRSDSRKQTRRRSKPPAISPSSGRFRTALSQALRSPTSGGATATSSPKHPNVRDFMPSPPHSPTIKLQHARQPRLSIVHEQEEMMRPSNSAFASHRSNAVSTAASLVKAGNRSSESSIVIGVGVGTPGPDARSLQAPMAPYDVSAADSPHYTGSLLARKPSTMFQRREHRSTLYPREASTIRRSMVRPMSSTLSPGSRASFDFTTELAGLESGTDRISFLQALEQSRHLDGMFGMTLAVDRGGGITRCSPSIVKASSSDVLLPQLQPVPKKQGDGQRRKPKSSTAPFAGEAGFSIGRPTSTWAPPQLPLPPLPTGARVERPNGASHQKQPSTFSFMSLSSLGEPLEGVLRDGQPTFERNYEGISDPPAIDPGSCESLADLYSLLDQADRSFKRHSSSQRLRPVSTSTTDSYMLRLPGSRQASLRSMESRMHQHSSATLASVNDVEIGVVTGPPVDLRRCCEVPSVLSFRGCKDSNTTVVPSPTQDPRSRYPSDASSAFSYGRVERPTLGARMFDCEGDYTLEAMCPVSPETFLEYRSFRERGVEGENDYGGVHPYSVDFMPRAQRAQASAVTIDLGKPSKVEERNSIRGSRIQGSSSTFDFGNYQHSQRSTSRNTWRSSNSSDQTVRMSVSLPRVFHARESSVSSEDEPYGGALDHYLKESPLTTISDRFAAALNSKGHGGPPARTSVLRPKLKSGARKHRPPRLHLSDRADNESLPDLVSPGDTSTEVSSLFSLETRNSIPPSGTFPSDRAPSAGIDVQPTIREESSFGTIRAGSVRRDADASHRSHHHSTLDWDHDNEIPGLPTFMPSSYHDIEMFLAESREAYQPLDKALPERNQQHKIIAEDIPSFATYSRAAVPPPETRYRNLRSNSDGDNDVPGSSLLAYFARDSQICSNSFRSPRRMASASSIADSGVRSSVTDSTRRRNLGWRRKRHSEDGVSSEALTRSPSVSSAVELSTQKAEEANMSYNRKHSTASAVSPLPTFISFSPPAPPKHGSGPSRRVMVDANGSPYAGWDDGPTAPLRTRVRDFSPLKHVSSKRTLQNTSDSRRPFNTLWSQSANSEAKSKIPLPNSKSQGKPNQQAKQKGRASKPKTPKMVPLKHQALPTGRGRTRVYVDKENEILL